MTINDRVKEIRKAEGLTLAKFGEKLGVTNMAISNIENGNRSVTGQMLKSICREFGYREEWLRDGIEPKQPPKLEEDELSEYIEDLLSTESPTYAVIPIRQDRIVPYGRKGRTPESIASTFGGSSSFTEA